MTSRSADRPFPTPVVTTLNGCLLYLLAHQPAGFSAVTGIARPFPGWEALARESGRAGRYVDATSLDRRISAHRHAILSRPGGYSEQRPAVVDWRAAGDALRLAYFTSDYAAGEVLRSSWRSLPAEVRREPLSGELQPVPLFGPSIGVDVTVRTADDRLILARRAPQLTFGGQWHISAAESVSLVDRVDGRLSLVPAAHRAVREELGLDTTGLPVLVHSLIFDAEYYAFGLGCHIDLSPAGLDAAAVREAHRTAPDGWEASELADVPFTVDSLLAPSREPHRWVPGAVVMLAGLASAQFGVDVRDVLPANSPR